MDKVNFGSPYPVWMAGRLSGWVAHCLGWLSVCLSFLLAGWLAVRLHVPLSCWLAKARKV